MENLHKNDFMYTWACMDTQNISPYIPCLQNTVNGLFSTYNQLHLQVATLT